VKNVLFVDNQFSWFSLVNQSDEFYEYIYFYFQFNNTNDIGIFYILISTIYYLLDIHEFKNPRNVLCEQTTNIGIHDIRYFTVDLS
jgi:hypothetical protein